MYRTAPCNCQLEHLDEGERGEVKSKREAGPDHGGPCRP